MSWLTNLEFEHPWFFLLMLIIPLMIWYYLRNFRDADANITLPNVHTLQGTGNFKALLYKWLPLLRWLAVAAFIAALAKPQLVLKEEEVKAEGIDIMLVMDLSSSMLARDFNPDRLSVSKLVAKQFVDKRQYDRLGLAVFAGESFTQCPLTTDHRILKEFLDQLQCGLLEDGTAIGMGLAAAVNRLKDSEAKSKVVILLTDGVNNAGYIKPMQAAEIAEQIDVKVYTIGVGTMGTAIAPTQRRSDGTYVFGRSRVEIDEALLREIATLTGGRYYRATTQTALQEIYAQIDQLEKTEIEVNVFKRYSDEFRKFLLLGLILLGIEWVMRYLVFRVVP